MGVNVTFWVSVSDKVTSGNAGQLTVSGGSTVKGQDSLFGVGVESVTVRFSELLVGLLV